MGSLEAEWRAFHQTLIAPETPPAGAITALRYAEINGITDGAAFMALKQLAASGVLKSGFFRVKTGDRHAVKRVRHWWRE
jgi:hypothetical protein